jgi:hypothetical protein
LFWPLAGTAAAVVKLLLCFNLLCTFPIVSSSAFQVQQLTRFSEQLT